MVEVEEIGRRDDIAGEVYHHKAALRIGGLLASS
jgi:hypothetical protein